MIEENVKQLLSVRTNAFGETVTLVAATKMRSAEEINRAIGGGHYQDVGENKVQEFCEKYDAVHGARRHFIGHLQTNKVKYLIGKVDLYHSVDRDELGEELARRSLRAGITSDILIQINIGNEETKGGYPLEEAMSAYERLSRTEGLKVLGLMAMLPRSDDEALLVSLCRNMRTLYERIKAADANIRYLSMGMSGDWKLCLKYGANMIRLGNGDFRRTVSVTCIHFVN